MTSKESTPVTFTEQEQLDLRNLNSNLELFSLLRSLLSQGQFPGNVSVALVRCQQLAESLVANTQKQIEEIEKAASSRSSKSESSKG